MMGKKVLAGQPHCHPGPALTGWGWAGGGRSGTLDPRHSGGPGQGHSPHSSHRRYSWLVGPARCPLRSPQTPHPAKERESDGVTLPSEDPAPKPPTSSEGPLPPVRGPAAGCGQVQVQGTAGSPPPDGHCCSHSPQPCGGTPWLWGESRDCHGSTDPSHSRRPPSCQNVPAECKVRRHGSVRLLPSMPRRSRRSRRKWLTPLPLCPSCAGTQPTFPTDLGPRTAECFPEKSMSPATLSSTECPCSEARQ